MASTQARARVEKLLRRMCSHVHKIRMRRLTYLRGHSALIVYTSYAKCASITLGLVRVTSDVSFLDRVCFPDMCIHPLLSIQNKAKDRYRCHVPRLAIIMKSCLFRWVIATAQEANRLLDVSELVCLLLLAATRTLPPLPELVPTALVPVATPTVDVGVCVGVMFSSFL